MAEGMYDTMTFPFEIHVTVIVTVKFLLRYDLDWNPGILVRWNRERPSTGIRHSLEGTVWLRQSPVTSGRNFCSLRISVKFSVWP